MLAGNLFQMPGTITEKALLFMREESASVDLLISKDINLYNLLVNKNFF